MPLYEYRCDACEHQFEVIQSFSDKPLKKCEKCGGKLQKLVSRAGFILKGGGWYKSDYAGSGAKAAKGAGDKGAGDKGAGDKGAGDKGAGDKGPGDKGSGDKGGTDGASASGDKAPAATGAA